AWRSLFRGPVVPPPVPPPACVVHGLRCTPVDQRLGTSMIPVSPLPHRSSAGNESVQNAPGDTREARQLLHQAVRGGGDSLPGHLPGPQCLELRGRSPSLCRASVKLPYRAGVLAVAVFGLREIVMTIQDDVARVEIHDRLGTG